MLPRALFAVAVASVAVTGCVRVSTVRLSAASSAIPTDSVRVFATHSPASDYQELAVLRVRRFFANDAKALRALRERAATLGANGLMLLNTRSGGGSMSGSGTGVVIGGPRSGEVIVGNVQTEFDDFERAVAIRYTPR